MGGNSLTQGKVLLIVGYPLLHNSSVSIQNRLLILGLSRLGYKVDVLCPEPNPFSISYDPSMEDIIKLVDNLYEVKLSNIYKFTTKLLSKKTSVIKPEDRELSNNISNAKQKNTMKNILRKFLAWIFDNIELTGELKLELKKFNIDVNLYDIVISSSDPKVAHMIAYKLMKNSLNKRPKWLQYWGDPWFYDIALKGKWKKPLVYFLEKRLVENASKVIYASPLTLAKQKRLFPRYSKKMIFVNQATEISDCSYTKSSQQVGEFVISYVGDYNSKIRDITPFLKSAEYFPKIKFRIVGSGDIKTPVNHNVEIIRKRLPLTEIREIEKSTHVFFVMTNKEGTQIPAKIYYLAGYTEKPIIIAVDGKNKEELKEFFQGFNRYIICENETNEIKNAISVAFDVVNKNIKFNLAKELTPENMVERILKDL